MFFPHGSFSFSTEKSYKTLADGYGARRAGPDTPPRPAPLPLPRPRRRHQGRKRPSEAFHLRERRCPAAPCFASLLPQEGVRGAINQRGGRRRFPSL